MRLAPFLGLLLVLPLLPFAPAEPATAGSAMDVELTVGGETAHGLVAHPSGAPTALVVIAHGYGHQAESHRGHLETLAGLGAAAIAMDYRGTGFPLRAGADDTIAATAYLRGLYPDASPVILYSVSMGTAVSSMVLAEAPVFDYWIDNEGLAMLHETWAGASVLAPANAFAAQALRDIEAECTGTPVQAPECYLERSAALRASEYTHLKGAYLTHGLNDGLVPYNQGREMVAALRAVGVPTDFYTVVRGEAGAEGTSVTGYTPAGGLGLAGHGSESNDAHTLTALSFGLLYALVSGDLAPPSNAEHVQDQDAPVLA